MLKKLIKRLLPGPLFEEIKRLRAKWILTSPRVAKKAIGHVTPEWRRRIDDVLSSPDNAHIPRHPSAGQIDGYTIMMHNGVQVCANGYYGSGILNMLIENTGVHEPQEERAFEEIIRLVPEDCVMLELGAYWGFYSLSLLLQCPQAKCYLVEPDTQNLLSGKINFGLNGREGHFTQAYVDENPKEKPQTISVDTFCQKHQIQHLNILHSDIQGFELAMLRGAASFLKEGRVDYLFISTHSAELHRDCMLKLRELGYVSPP